MDQARIKELRESLNQDPLSEGFLELAQILSSDSSSRAEAREICFKALSLNPNHHAGRLILAKLFYLDSMTPFCVRELLEVRKHVESESLDRLLLSFGERYSGDSNKGNSHGANTEVGQAEKKKEVVAELDIDAEFLDVLEDIDLE